MLELNNSRYFKHFKKLLGTTNHFLITILIGIDGVEKGKVKKDDAFHAAWNPMSLTDSTRRSRCFVLAATLAWALDALDAYFGFLRKSSSFKFNNEEQSELKLSDRSLSCSFDAIIKFCEYKIDFSLSIVHLGIKWRNKLVHYHAENKLDKDYKNFLLHVKPDEIEEKIRNTNIEVKDMIDRYENNEKKSPTFKEVATIIQCIINVVSKLDMMLVQHVDMKQYCLEVIVENEVEFKNVLSCSPDKKVKKMEQFLITKGGFIPSERAEGKKLLTTNDIEEIIQEIDIIRKNGDDLKSLIKPRSA
jgi:hypothetical protein